MNFFRIIAGQWNFGGRKADVLAIGKPACLPCPGTRLSAPQMVGFPQEPHHFVRRQTQTKKHSRCICRPAAACLSQQPRAAALLSLRLVRSDCQIKDQAAGSRGGIINARALQLLCVSPRPRARKHACCGCWSGVRTTRLPSFLPPPFGFLWTTGGRLGHVCVPLRAVEHYSCSRAARTRLLVQPYVQHWVRSWVVRTTVVTSSFRRTPAVMLCAIARPLGEYGHTPVHHTAIGWQTVSTDGTMGKGSAAI